MLNGFTLGLGQGVKHLGLHHLAAADRGKGKAHVCPQYCNVLFLPFLAQLLECFLLGHLEFVVDGLAPVAIVFRLEHIRDGRTQIINEFRHVCLEFRTDTRGKQDCLRAIGSRKIVDIDPVVGNGLCCRLALQEFADGAMAARRRGSQGKYVESVMVDLGPELDRGQGPMLANEFANRLKFRGGGEFQQCWIAAQPELMRSERQTIQFGCLVD
ncbi:MAG: hypothetical protein WCB71_14580 [Aestuariivirga sp.]